VPTIFEIACGESAIWRAISLREMGA
jgi:predicted RNA-binding Zn-ribbon protein involved in translation (DUF1610 family)